MKNCLLLLFAAIIVMALALSGFAREKYYVIRIGRLNDFDGQPSRPGSLRIWTYNNFLHQTQLEQTADFAMGVLVPVVIKTHGKIAIETDKVRWADFVTVDVRFARMKKAEHEYCNDDIEELVQPASTWKASLFSGEWKAYSGGGGAVIDFYDDKVWFLVKFDNPELLKEGNYVFLPTVDFDGIAKALPDLVKENFEGEKELDKDEFCPLDFVEHGNSNLTPPEGRRNAINMRLLEADRMYGFRKRDLALRCIREVFEIDPYSAAGWFTLGELYYGEKDFEKACECMRKALESAENGRDAQLDEERRSLIIFYLCMRLGRCCLVLRRFDDAEHLFLRARETLNDRAMDPGCAIDDHWGGEGALTHEYTEMARKGEPLDE